MVLHIRAPRAVYSIQYLKQLFEAKYKLPKRALKDYVPIDTALQLAEYDGRTLLHLLENSDKIYAFVFEDHLYIHPNGFIHHVSAKYRKLISSEISRTRKLLQGVTL